VKDLEPPFRGNPTKDHQPVPVSRPNFIELCEELTHQDEKIFEDLFRRLGLSVDWNYLYATIDERSRRASQRAFLRNLARGEAYSQEAPTLWDVDFKTAVAQAELEDRERPGAYHTLAFHKSDGSGDILIDTTRPELLVSCCALVAHPDDERYQAMFNSTVRTPVFNVEVPVLAHPLAQPDKGTGIAMICTFGDLTDVIWWRELQLPTRAVIMRDGRLMAETPEWITDSRGVDAYAAIAGKFVNQAQRATVEMLRTNSEMIGEPKAITHPVKFYEKGDRPLEIVTSRQWYIRNGGRDVELRNALLKRGEEITWHPDYMQHRYTNWVEGLNGDWLISRQRYFGVPVPVWYRTDAEGNPLHDGPIVPSEDQLPIDPSTDVPTGFSESQRNQPNGFVGDPDVMDTWATSSLTPQIAGKWEDDKDLFSRVFPMDVRPQGHDIIRTWLFSTTVRSHFEHGVVPWSNAALSGWILDPDRKKMSKSKGNVVTPIELFEQYGSDAVRYWAASARPGVDTAFSEDQMKVGRKLATKLLNVSKFVLGFMADHANATTVTEAVDHSMLLRLGSVIDEASSAFEAFDYARALERTEQFFWWFCDDYVELVKVRAYRGANDPGAQSAVAALNLALSALQRLFAPMLPFVTEEIWSWWQDGSIHNAPWPTSNALGATGVDILDPVCEVLAVIRRAKTEAKTSQRTPVAVATVTADATFIAAVQTGQADLIDAGTVENLRFVEGDGPTTVVELAQLA
jgi:valyl-tRNA synthetase